MRIAFVGKGGSGKTTTAAMFSRYAAGHGHRVVAVDADINQHLAQALGHDGTPPRPLGADLTWIEDHLRGDNPRIPDGTMIKTTPPGRGSRLLDLAADDAVLRRFAVRTGDVLHLAAGELDESDVGVRVLGNKVGDPADADYLREHVGGALLGWLVQSPWVRAAERGRPAPLDALEPANREVLATLLDELDAQVRDWAAYHRGTVELHLRNAASWANQAVGADLALQVDPDFVPGPVAGVA